MYKKWLSCVLSVLCLFSLFWGLSLNTLEVKAAYSYSNTKSMDFVAQNVATGGSGAGTISNGSGSSRVTIQSVSGGVFHVKVPYCISCTWTDLGFQSTPLKSDFVTFWINSGHSITPTLTGLSSSYTYSISNKTISFANGDTWGCSDSDLEKDRFPLVTGTCGNYWIGSNLFTLLLYVEYDLTITGGYAGTSYPADLRGNLSTNFSCTLYGRLATSSEVSSGSLQVIDQGTQAQLNTLNDTSTAIQESSEAIAESVTSDTGGGLLATIKNFFGGFFSNLINSILGLFVPDSNYFSTWFSNLNTLLSDKLGMLYAPFDLLISTLNAVYSADTTEPGITFPGISWDGETVIAPYTFYFSSLGEDFQNLRDAVYFGTDVVLLFAFLHLLQKKIALVITGSEVNG